MKEIARIEFNEDLATIKAYSDKMKKIGYSCKVDISKPSIEIKDERGIVKFYVTGLGAQKYIDDFSDSTQAYDNSISIEDFMLSAFLFGK